MESETRAKNRAKQRILVLIKEIESCREALNKTDSEALKKITKNKRTVINEIFAAAGKKDPKNNRYSDDWIILCLLLHMRSPAAYRMLRDNKTFALYKDNQKVLKIVIIINSFAKLNYFHKNLKLR